MSKHLDALTATQKALRQERITTKTLRLQLQVEQEAHVFWSSCASQYVDTIAKWRGRFRRSQRRCAALRRRHAKKT